MLNLNNIQKIMGKQVKIKAKHSGNQKTSHTAKRNSERGHANQIIKHLKDAGRGSTECIRSATLMSQSCFNRAIRLLKDNSEVVKESIGGKAYFELNNR